MTFFDFEYRSEHILTFNRLMSGVFAQAVNAHCILYR